MIQKWMGDDDLVEDMSAIQRLEIHHFSCGIPWLARI
jgi:hypothetical protein